MLGGGNIITCTQNPRNSVADNTVPVNVVPRTFRQAPMVLAHMTRQWSVPLRFVTISLSLVPLTSYQFFFPSILSSLSARSWSPLENTPSPVPSWINYIIERFKIRYLCTSRSRKSQDSWVPCCLYWPASYLEFLLLVRDFLLSKEKAGQKGFLKHLLHYWERVSCIVFKSL